MIDARGNVAAHTGNQLHRRGGRPRRQGLLRPGEPMANDRVWPAMAKAFEEATGTSPTGCSPRSTRRRRGRRHPRSAVGGPGGGRWNAHRPALGRPGVDLRVEDSPGRSRSCGGCRRGACLRAHERGGSCGRARGRRRGDARVRRRREAPGEAPRSSTGTPLPSPSRDGWTRRSPLRARLALDPPGGRSPRSSRRRASCPTTRPCCGASSSRGRQRRDVEPAARLSAAPGSTCVLDSRVSPGPGNREPRQSRHLRRRLDRTRGDPGHRLARVLAGRARARASLAFTNEGTGLAATDVQAALAEVSGRVRAVESGQAAVQGSSAHQATRLSTVQAPPRRRSRDRRRRGPGGLARVQVAESTPHRRRLDYSDSATASNVTPRTRRCARSGPSPSRAPRRRRSSLEHARGRRRRPGSFCDFQLRVDGGRHRGGGRWRSGGGVRPAGSGGGLRTASVAAYFTRVAAGSHTVSIWVRGSAWSAPRTTGISRARRAGGRRPRALAGGGAAATSSPSPAAPGSSPSRP